MSSSYGKRQSRARHQSHGSLMSLFNHDNESAHADPPAEDEPPEHGPTAYPTGPQKEPEDAAMAQHEPVDIHDPGYRRAWMAFRQWRRTRPFWAGVLCLLGGALMAYGPLRGFRFILIAGTVVWAGILIGLLVCVMGLFMWFAPQLRQILGILAAIFSIVSLITSNFGGYFIGLLLGALGGAMGFAWTPLAASGREIEGRPAGLAAPGQSTPEDQRTGQSEEEPPRHDESDSYAHDVAGVSGTTARLYGPAIGEV